MDSSGDSTNHRPTDPSRFIFDESVAEVFPDMARRSIPLYEMAHEINADLIVDHLHRYQTSSNRILDLGTSRGEFFTYLDDAISQRRMESRVVYEGMGIDASEAMIHRAMDDHPGIAFGVVRMPEELNRQELPNKYLIINAMYTLQFMPLDEQRSTVKLLAENYLHEDGLMLIGTKHRMGRRAESMYIDWRIRNGYAIADIVAKSNALRGTMHPPTPGEFTQMFTAAGLQVAVLTHSMVFSTYFATRTKGIFEHLFKDILG